MIIKLQHDNAEPRLSLGTTRTQVGELETSYQASSGTGIKDTSLNLYKIKKRPLDDMPLPVNSKKERILSQPVPLADSGVAFYAYRSNSIPPSITAPNHVFIFDIVRTNIGRGYHPSTGVFIVPEAGIYVLTWTFLNRDGNVHSVQLMINSNECGILHLHTESTTAVPATGIVVALVNKGDDVFVKTS
ncbi:uncharacterized protein LOC134277186, partial [Saccostrea cucullata]|uniref:uncharacterized protein LOC134277186 n=1 Tax=Saccostrea cuccullata TaxID=36930 RepID=UPI002ED67490